MKKLKLILPLLLILTLLSGCGWLDEMKMQQAHDYGNGIIKYNEATYQYVDLAALDLKDFADYLPIEHGKDLYITAPDVPVLLSQMGIYKYYPYVNPNETIIDYTGEYYVREDCYNEVVSQLQAGIQYTKYKYYLGKDTVYFTDTQTETLKTFIKETTPVNAPEDFYSNVNLAVYCESEGGLFFDYLYEIVKHADSYALLQYTEDGQSIFYPSNKKYDVFFSSLLTAVEKEEVFFEKY